VPALPLRGTSLLHRNRTGLVAIGTAVVLALAPAFPYAADPSESSLPSILRNQLAQQKQARERVDQLVASILDHGYDITISSAQTKVVVREKIAEIEVPVTVTVTASILTELEETVRALGGKIRYPSGRSRSTSREFFVMISKDSDLPVYFHQRVGQLIFSLQVVMESGAVYPCSDRVKPAAVNPIARDPTNFGVEVKVLTEPIKFIAHVETSAEDASRITSIAGKIVEASPIRVDSDSLNRADASRVRCRF
jgi:hypothetical protein